MSLETENKIANAIAEHIADAWPDEQRILTDWVLVAAHFGDQPGETGYSFTNSDAPMHVINGLLQFANKNYEIQLQHHE